MKVLTEEQTLEYMLHTRCSIARYGDGELKLCLGRAAKSQVPTPFITNKMRDILYKDDGKVLTCIPRIYEKRKDWPTEKKQQFWKKYTSDRFTKFLNPHKTYGSSFITRPDASLQLNWDFMMRVKELWRDDAVLLIKGREAQFNKDPSIFDTARSVDTYLGPPRDAGSAYEKILYEVLQKTTEKTTIVLSLGPAATLLAYGLASYGRRALDMGHFGIFYSKVHPKMKETRL